MTTARRAAIYCRISRDHEGMELGVQRQQADCEALAAQHRYTVTEVYVDNDISASTRTKKARPRFEQMLNAAREGQFDAILAYTTSRLTRRPLEHERLIQLAEQHGIAFLYVRSPSFDLNTAAGRRVARILAATDAGEAEETQERISRQKLQAARDGAWRGGRRPYGYEADGKTVRVAEALEVHKASEAIVAGRSLAGLAKDLNDRGVPTSTGAKWDSVGLSRVLRRPRNAGLIERDGRIFGQAKWPAIVDEPLWRGVCAVLGDPSRRTSPGPARRWLGSGLYMCHCGEPVRVHLSASGRPSANRSYTCSVTRHMARIASEVDALVGTVVVEWLSRPDARDLLAADMGEDPTEAILQAKVARAKLEDVALLFADGTIAAFQLATISKQLRSELDGLEARIAAAARVSVLSGLVGFDDIGDRWAALHLDRKRAVIDRLFTVELWPAGRGRRKGWKAGESYFDPSTVRFRWKV